MALPADLEQQLEVISGVKLDFKEIPQHPEIQDLLDWELHEFTVRAVLLQAPPPR